MGGVNSHDNDVQKRLIRKDGKGDEMKSPDFYVDFNVEVPHISQEFTVEAERELRALAAEHTDLIGSAVSLETIAGGETTWLYQVRIVVYKRPDDLAAVEKSAQPMDALRDALAAITEQVRSSRERLSQQSPHAVDEKYTIADELTPGEVYATYMNGKDPDEILDQGRTQIATRLMVEEGLNQKAAYFAADKIMQAAQQRLEDRK